MLVSIQIPCGDTRCHGYVVLCMREHLHPTIHTVLLSIHDVLGVTWVGATGIEQCYAKRSFRWDGIRCGDELGRRDLHSRNCSFDDARRSCARLTRGAMTRRANGYFGRLPQEDALLIEESV